MKANRFRYQVAQLFRGQVLYALAQFLLLALLSRFGDNSESGKYVLALATTAPIFLFLDLDLRTVRSTDQKNPEAFQSYFGLRLWCLFLAAFLSLSAGFLFFRSSLAVFIVVTIFRIGDSLSNLAYGGLQRMAHTELVGKSLTIKGLITIPLVLLVAWISGGSAVLVGVGMATVSILIAIFRDLPNAFALNQPDTRLSLQLLPIALTDFPAHIRITKRALPLGIDSLLSSLILNIPKYYVHAIMGMASLGVFGLLMQLAYSVQLLIGAVGHTGVAPLAELKANGERERFWKLLSKMSLTSLLVGILAAIGGTLVIPKTFAFLLGAEYDQPLLVMLLLIASCLTGTQRTISRATQATGNYLAYMIFDVLIFLGSLSMSNLLIAPLGLVGAAGALVVAFGIGLLATLIHTHYLLWPKNQHIDFGTMVSGQGDDSDKVNT